MHPSTTRPNYDNAGNVISVPGPTNDPADKVEYDYDVFNRITRVRRGGTDIAEYAYDALGRRVYRKVINSGNLNTAPEGEFLYYDGNRLIDQLHGVAASGPQPRREIVYGLDYIDEPIAQYLTDNSGNVTQQFILQDANYNVVALTDSSGNLHQEYHYSPYGELVAAYDSSGTALTLPDQLDTILTFQGGMLDPETGNIEKRARTLLTSLGRFAQKDAHQTGLLISSALLQNAQTPIAFVSLVPGGQYFDGLNPYEHVRSNPLIGLDPAGTRSLTEVLAGMGIQGTLGGFINGFVARLAGKDFFEGFKTGFVGGALGGSTGFAFQAGRAGFLGSVVLGGAAEGFVEAGASAFYSEGDFRAALVDGLYGAGVGAATGGLISIGKRGFDAIRTSQAARAASGDISLTSMILQRICFAAGTPVAMADGSLVSIEQIKVGDRVLCDYDPEASNGPESCLVTKTFERMTNHLLRLTIASDEGEATLDTTPDHPFYNEDSEEYVAARDLSVGMPIRTVASSQGTVAQKGLRIATVPVYNLTVRGAHNYFVSEARILVHNTCLSEGFWAKTYRFVAGEVQMSGNVKIVGTRLHIDDATLYGSGRQALSQVEIGVEGLLFIKNDLARMAREFPEVVDIKLSWNRDALGSTISNSPDAFRERIIRVR